MHVAIVRGDANHNDASIYRFSFEAKLLADKLIARFRFKKGKNLTYIRGNRDSVIFELETLLIEKEKGDICLFYLGHGAKNGWALSGYEDKEILEYERLRLIFSHHFGNLIFVNDCCYALAGKAALSDHAGNHLFIGAMPADRFGPTEGFTANLLNCWSAGVPFEPKAWVCGDLDNRFEIQYAPNQKCALFDDDEFGAVASINLYLGNPSLHLLMHNYKRYK